MLSSSLRAQGLGVLVCRNARFGAYDRRERAFAKRYVALGPGDGGFDAEQRSELRGLVREICERRASSV